MTTIDLKFTMKLFFLFPKIGANEAYLYFYTDSNFRIANCYSLTELQTAAAYASLCLHTCLTKLTPKWIILFSPERT